MGLEVESRRVPKLFWKKLGSSTYSILRDLADIFFWGGLCFWAFLETDLIKNSKCEKLILEKFYHKLILVKKKISIINLLL